MTPEQKAKLFFEIEGFGLSERPTFWSLTEYLEEIQNSQSQCFFQSENDDVGFVLYRLNPGEIDIFQWAVRNKGTGYATVFFKKFVESCKTKHPDALRMILEVHEDNHRARKFYEKFGFSKISRRKKYYRDSKDALIFEMRLGPS